MDNRTEISGGRDIKPPRQGTVRVSAVGFPSDQEAA